jgi:hypothetical protein
LKWTFKNWATFEENFKIFANFKKSWEFSHDFLNYYELSNIWQLSENFDKICGKFFKKLIDYCKEYWNFSEIVKKFWIIFENFAEDLFNLRILINIL